MLDIENILRYNIKENYIQLNWNINENVHDNVYGDIINIKHCIINLIKNAIKYGNNNSNIIINISNINEENEYQSIIISVLDNNCFILKYIKQNLFKPFNSTSGSGLGLYIARSIIKMHGGNLICKSKENQGSLFEFYVPIKK